VTNLISGLGQKHLVRITADGHTITATLKHPVWLADEQRWIATGCGKGGQVPYGSDGLPANVAKARLDANDKSGNYAAGRLDDGDVVIGRSRRGVHAEEDVYG